MIDFINSLDSTSVFIGMAYAYLLGVVTSVIDYFTEKALKEAEARRAIRRENAPQSHE